MVRRGIEARYCTTDDPAQPCGVRARVRVRKPNAVLSRAIESPEAPGASLQHMMTVALGDKGEISNVIDGVGGPTSIRPRITPKVNEFPAKTTP